MDTRDMPAHIVDAFECYLDGAGQNVSEVARILTIPRSTAQSWSERYRWPERADALHADEARRAITRERVRDARRLSHSGDVIDAALSSRIGSNGKPEPGTPTVVALRAALATMERHGMSPTRLVQLDLTHRVVAAVSDAELDALIAAGDTATLLALAAGLPPRTDASTDTLSPPPLTDVVVRNNAPHPLLPPPDFPSDQSGGRAGPEPSSPVTEASETPNSSSYGYGRSTIEALFRERDSK